MNMTLEDLEVREALLNMRADTLPAVERTFTSANSFDLRKVRDQVERERLRKIRDLSKQLVKELRATR